MIVMGLETSCDETAVGLVTHEREILANVVLSQIDEHRPFGGVVPEIAARAHLDHFEGLVRRAMDEAGVGFEDLDAVAATAGPGLIGGVMVGTTAAKAIALVLGVPFVAVNHLEAHALTARLTDGVDFPFLALLATGGHCQLVIADDVGAYRLLGTTLDDAVGEAFDKVAKMLGLGFPGGPEIERTAPDGDAARFAFPRPMKGRPGCDFSFSGLKTAVRHAVAALPDAALGDADVADVAASFQAAVGDILVERCANAISAFREHHPKARTLVAAGGVAANQTVRRRLGELADQREMRLVVPPSGLCTDNGVMIAWTGLERLQRGRTDELDFKARPRWPLDPRRVYANGAARPA
ncbi:MAG: tRNA (adenosine(37)-N6)-threonylcarbamoyltransferase complex transferase subunit TsaD [Rhodospirillales bacterium]|jgi:N6-L-threonylcarbamoyladenine synthase|nr:tRNA (adenosine(37)-N6)-threonylcarbamoyltransferase complex transferase subunit TsaD [Rhodospirillales bacterium]MDP6804811.1 tRNA (adenosine(37)-N6)-threonylcarbamoyltransferase complex transferase subunit TsaD [Rhodospirillales bacterium]